MAKAFIKDILPNGSTEVDDIPEHQVSPGWVLTCVRWAVRDTLRTNAPNMLETLPQMVIENDCIDVKVTCSKGAYTPSMEATLKITDTNYLTALAAGDFVFVNMFNWEKHAREFIVRIDTQGGHLNGQDDGFKGLFKIQSVRETLGIDPATGKKAVMVRITGFAFTEFNNAAYFNPNLINSAAEGAELLFVTDIAKFWPDVINQKGTVNVQDIIALLIQGLVGAGVSGDSKEVGGATEFAPNDKPLMVSPNTHFFVPKLVGRMLGLTNVSAAKDLYTYVFGIQSFNPGGQQALGIGMNPAGLSRQGGGRFFYTPTPCEGRGYLKTEFWNNVKTWSIINQYTNAPLNELFNSFKVDRRGLVMPTMTFRQIPFSTEGASDAGAITRFMTLPRWRIHPGLVTNYDLGRDEAARINFVQFFGASVEDKNGTNFAYETAHHNYVYDIEDVRRNGLRPYIVSTQFDETLPADGQKSAIRSPQWAKIMGDALIGGHLKMNGGVACQGIQEPIAVGDNLEFNGIVYHIEQVEHVCALLAEGGKMFRTKLALSNGVSIDSESGFQRYGEMKYSVAYKDRTVDYNDRDQILPGVSEAQDTVSRQNTDIDTGKGNSVNSSFAQPNKKK